MESLLQYFKSLLTEKNQHWAHTLAALTSLTHFLKEEQRSEPSARASDIASGLFDSLINVIETPCNFITEGGFSPGKNPTEARSSPPSVTGMKKKEAHPLVYVEAIKCIYHSLLMTIRTFKITSKLLQVLLTYISPESKGPGSNSFFQYSSVFTEVLRDMILSQTLPCSFRVKAVFYENSAAENTDVLEELRFYGNKEFMSSVLLQGAVKKCSLTLETSDSNKNVSKELVKNGVAWEKYNVPGCQANKADEVADKTRRKNPGQRGAQTLKPDSCDTVVCVTNVLHGNFVWLVMGEDKICQIQSVKKILREECETTPVPKPQVYDVLAARIYSTKELIRARIITVRNTAVLVMDVDSGKFYRVRPLDIFILPWKLNLVKIPPLACMARLADVYPTPVDSRAVEVALASLCLICRYTKEQKLVQEHKIMSLLPALIRCPHNKVAIQSLRLATILLFKLNQENKKFWQSLILASLGSLNKTVQRTFSSLKQRNNKQEAAIKTDCQSSEVAPSTGEATPVTKEIRHEDRILAIANCVLLGNVLHMCPIAKEYFYSQHGLTIVLQVLVLFKRNHGTSGAAFHTLSNFVHISERVRGFQKHWRERSQSKHLISTGADACQTEQQAFENSEDESSFSDDSEKEADGADVNANFASKGYRLKKAAGNWLYIGRTEKEFYIRGAVVDFCTDSTHELVGSVKVRADFLAGTLCGMLNTGHKGTIYIGISENGEVVGECLNHDLRDQVRMGIDRILINRIQPSVLHSQFSVDFVPVVDWSLNNDNEERITHYNELFVLEISIRPVPRVLYSLGGLQTFYRVGATTMELSKQDVRQMVVIEEEAWHRDRVEDLQKELDDLNALLANQ